MTAVAPWAPFDWERAAPVTLLLHPGASLLDETLRDGLQNPSVCDPTLDEKVALLHTMDGLGIHAVNLGLPASSARACDDVLALAREIGRSRLRIRAAAAGRTVVSDLVPIAAISQRTGVPIEAYAFIGSSAIRRLAESWDLASILRRTSEAISFAVREGLRVCYVTEDTTRTHPDTLRAIFGCALASGATALCVADTVGHATPDGVSAIVAFTRAVIAETGARDIRIDWHGHNDRGLALQNACWALRAGADRVHGTALGIGERVGNVPMDLLLLNLALRGEIDVAPDAIAHYCAQAARAVGWAVPENHPLVGRSPRGDAGDALSNVGE
jgi:2-isopropylmalate synthase